MDELHCRRNVWLYRIYVLFNEPLFWGPILITTIQKLGHMSLPAIYYQESVVLCICVALDMPSGALADIIGRKVTILIGRVFLLGSVVAFASMHSPVEAWIANILWAIGFSLQSGADTALLYDSLKEQGKESDYKRIEGGAVGARLLLMAFCAIIAGWVASYDLRLPLILSVPFVGVPFIAACFFKEPPRLTKHSVQEHVEKLRTGVVLALHSTQVRWMLGFAALLSTTSKLWFFTYNPYFELVHLPVAWYGIVFFCLNIVAWLSSRYAYRFEERFGERASVVSMVACLGAPIVAMGLVVTLPSAFLVVIQNVVRGFMRPFTLGYLNRHIACEARATVISAQSSLANLASIMGLALFGYLIHVSGLATSLVILGITMLVFGVFSYRTYVNKVVG